MFKALIAFLIFSNVSYCFSAPLRHKITESILIDLAKSNSPSLNSIKSSMLFVQTERNRMEEDYAAEVFGRGSYSETQERPIIEFLPVFSPVKQAQIGVRQKFSNGFQAEASATSDQRSSASPVSGRYNNVTTTTLSLTLQMDLWRDLFGRVSSAERKTAQMDAQRSKIEEKIRTKAFELSLRKIYWSLVANNEQLKIAERLKSTAQQQVLDSQKRLRSAIGDQGEVARYEAQLAARSGQVIYFTFQKESLYKQLKNLLPDFGMTELYLGDYDLSKTLNEVVECSAIINQKPAVPYEFTNYDEMINLLREVKSLQKTINQRYSDVDLKLYGTVKATGVGSDKQPDSSYQGSFGASTRDMTVENRSGYEAGVRMNIPLGDAKKNTQDTKTLYDELRLKAAIDNSEATVVSTHTQLAKSMGLISQVIVTQKMSTRALEKRLDVIKKKYSQARVSVNDMILDQDALLNSELNTINAQLEAVNVMFDYFMIFTETPCSFNRI